MKIFSISDLHLSLCGQKPMEVFGDNWNNYTNIIREDWQKKVSDDDLVLIAGDISWAMKIDEFKLDLKFFDYLKGKKVFIRGNHDYWWSSLQKVQSAMNEDMYAIQNNCIRFDNIIICGTRGWVIPEMNCELSAEDKKIYDHELLRARMSLDAMKKIRKEGDKVIFMIHYPPFNSTRNNNEFLELFKEYNVSCVIYGHLHGNKVKTTKFEELNGISFYLTSTDQVNHHLVEINF